MVDRKLWLKLLAPVLASIAGLVALRLLGPDVVDQATISTWLEPLGTYAPLAFIVFLAVRPLTLLPGQFFTAAGGLMFGTLMGSTYALIGSFLSSALIFVLSRRLGTRLIKRMAGKRYEALTRAAKKHDFNFALLTCINPFLPTDVMIAAASGSGARFLPTTLGVLAGTIPGTILTAQFGSAIGQGKTVMTIVSAIGMILSLGLGVVLGRRMVKDIQGGGDDRAANKRSPQPGPARIGVGTKALAVGSNLT